MSHTAFICCTVLSVQDANVLYPSCSNCFSRLLVSEDKTSRWSCPKCGWDSEVAGYRYRLSLKVSKDCAVLGVTVFGSCLDPFFGVPAGQFQRFLTAVKKREGFQKAELLLRKSLEDCFVGRCVSLGIKLPGGDCGSTTSLTASLKSEQCIAGKISPLSDGVFGVSVIRYLQSLLLVCKPSDTCEVPEASLHSEQSSYHDYTQLCPAGSCCLHSWETDSASAGFPSPLLQSPGPLSLQGDSLGYSTPAQQREPVASPAVPSQERRRGRCGSLCDVSAAKRLCRCCEERRVSIGQESGYGGTSRDGESFSVPFTSDEPWTHSSPLSDSHVGLLARSDSAAFPRDELASSCSSSTRPQGSACRLDFPRLISSETGSSPRPVRSDGPSLLTSDTEDTWEKNARAAPKAVERLAACHGCEDVYNYSAELFDVSALDTSDLPTAGALSDQVPCRPQTRHTGPHLAPCSQSTPIGRRGAPGRRRGPPARCHYPDMLSERGRRPSPEQGQWETGRASVLSMIDSRLDHCLDEGGCCVSETFSSLTTEEADWSKDLFIDS